MRLRRGFGREACFGASFGSGDWFTGGSAAALAVVAVAVVVFVGIVCGPDCRNSSVTPLACGADCCGKFWGVGLRGGSVTPGLSGEGFDFSRDAFAFFGEVLACGILGR